MALIVSNKSPKELEYMRAFSKQLVLEMSDDAWEYRFLKQSTELEQLLREAFLADIVCIDVTMQASIHFAEHVRKTNPKSFMVLVSDTAVSPMTYMKPSIVAQSLLLRPYQAAQLREVFREAFVTYLHAYDSEDGSERFVVETREGRQLIAFEHILFFEAREKKIFLNMDKNEFSFYSTLEVVQESLPADFERCHRGFIVNKKKIKQIKLSQNTITLANGMEIPLSRAYKAIFKELR
ncbi:MAG: LytTR family DNA-binding domain-containing protein [Oscillospiraceae bacterium]